MQNLDPVWWTKYKPKTIDDYVFQNPTHKATIEKYLKEKTIPHLLFTGVQGTGKTALAELLIREMEVDPLDVLTINASKENNVETVREKIANFVNVYPFGSYKIVFLDEADYITPNGQGILRILMVDHIDTTRFIIACNYENKIIPALKSRSHHIHFKASDIDDVTVMVTEILIKEKVKFNLKYVDKYVALGYPDIRQILVLLEENTFDKVLAAPPSSASSGSDYKFQLLDLVEQDKWSAMRKVVCDNVLAEEWEDLFRFLYENLNKSPTFTVKKNWEAGIVLIAEYLYKHTLVADPEINFAALLIELQNVPE